MRVIHPCHLSALAWVVFSCLVTPLHGQTKPSPFCEWPRLNLRSSNFPADWYKFAVSESDVQVELISRDRKSHLVLGIDDAVEPGVSADELATRLATRVLSRWTNGHSSGKHEPREALGIAGICGEVEGEFEHTPVRSTFWVGSKNGRTYFLQVLNHPSNAASSLATRSQFLNCLALIDDKRQFEPKAAEPIKSFVSPAFGYGILPPTGDDWREYPAIETLLPGADFGMKRGTRTVFAVFAIPFGEMPSTERILQDALLSATTVNFGDLQKIEPLRIDDLTGIRALASRKTGANELLLRVALLKSKEYGFLVMGWCDNEVDIPVIDRAIANLNFRHLIPLTPALPAFGGFTTTRPTEAFDPKRLTSVQLRMTALSLNNAGLACVSTRNYREANRYFRRSLLLIADPTVSLNLVITEADAGNLKESFEAAKQGVMRFPSDVKLISAAATTAQRIGNTDDATFYYRLLFAKGTVNDVSFTDFIDLLATQQKIDQAIKEIQEYSKRSNNDNIAVLHANLLLAAKRHEEAAKLLESRPITSATAIPLSRAYFRSFRYEDVLRVLEKVTDSSTNVDYHVMKGLALSGLHRTAEAKASLDKAAALRPGDPQIADLVKNTAGQLGQGNNAAIKVPIGPLDVPAELLAAPATAAPLDTSAGAVYLSKVRVISFEAGKPQKTSDYASMRILDRRGTENFNTLSFALDPLREKLFVNRLEVYDEKGALLASGKPEDSYILDVPTGEYASFEQKLTVPVPALRPGCEIRLCLTREQRNASDTVDFLDYSLAGMIPTLRSSLLIRGDLAKITSHESGVQKQSRFGGWLWQVDGPQTFVFEPRSTYTREFLPYVTLAPAKAQWTDVGNQYLKIISERLADTPTIKTQLTAVVSPSMTPTEKVLSLARHVQNTLSYHAVAFGRSAWVPNTPDQIFERRFGDCKDHALTLHLLLRAAGIPSHLALVNSHDLVLEDLPSLDQFDHMIVYVPNLEGKDWWLDCTNKYCGFKSQIPAGLAEHDALVLSDQPTLKKIPAHELGSFVYHVERHLTVNPEGEIKVLDRTTMDGLLADGYRSGLQGDPASLSERAAKSLISDLSKVRSATTTVEHLEDPTSPLVITMAYNAPQKLRGLGGRLLGEVPAAPEYSLLQADVVENRRTPFRLFFPLKMTVDLTLSLPPGWTVEGWDEEKHHEQNDDFLTSTIDRSVNADGSLHASMTVLPRTGAYSAAQYAGFISSRQSLLDVWACPLVVRKGKN